MWKDFDVNYDGKGGKLSVKTQQQGGAWGTLIKKYKNFITGVSAVAAVTFVILFIIKFLNLGTSANNPSERAKAITGIIWTGIAAACTGCVALIVGIFYNAVD